MVTVNGIEYGTKDEAAQRCKEFAGRNPGTSFHNYAHCKCIRRETTEAERAAMVAAGGYARLTVTLYEWNKLYNDAHILNAHPELKGLWHENSTYANTQAQKGGRDERE